MILLMTIPNGLQTALGAIVVLVASRGLDWLLKRRAEKVAERTANIQNAATITGSGNATLDVIAQRAAQLALLERQRAEELEKKYKDEIDNLHRQVDGLREQIETRNTVINEQALQISALQNQVADLERKMGAR